jgi:hypothetical protein
MTWTLAIAIFLGTLLAVPLIFFISSQIRQALREQRIERRTSAKVGVALYSPDEPLPLEMALTENVSPHGARVVTKKRWRPNDCVLVRLPWGDEPARAQIAYCDALPGEVFAIGLQFSSTAGDWRMSRSINHRSNPFRK